MGSQAADGFSLLMSDSSDVLNRGCHADVRIMYRQRFFAENSATLVGGFSSAEKGAPAGRSAVELNVASNVETLKNSF